MQRKKNTQKSKDCKKVEKCKKNAKRAEIQKMQAI